MIFNSISYVIFLPIIFVLYYILPHKYRIILLLIASCIFYMAFIPWYITILAVLIIIDYVMGIAIESKKKYKKLFLFISIISDVGILVFFKYFNFFNVNIAGLAHIIDWNYSPSLLSFALPIGLSFHTFQSLSYIFEVYKGDTKAERNFLTYAVYVMFFPQLVAGPIERPYQLLPQFHKKIAFSYPKAVDGLQRILLGMFKKVVIADNLAILVNQVFNNLHDYIGIPLILAVIAFAFEIYCDFSGYTDIAIGSAKLLGIDLVENFNYPYLATSIPDFWRRWHMSLYNWFRDYVYIPLGGNRVTFWRNSINILIVFTISGLWHGANWTFIAWGFLHGMYMTLYTLLRKIKKVNNLGSQFVKNLFGRIVAMLFTFFLVCIAWIFFRAATFADAFYVLSHIPKGLGSIILSVLHFQWFPLYEYSLKQGSGIGLTDNKLLFCFTALLILEIVQYLYRTKRFFILPQWSRWGVYVLLCLFIFNMGSNHALPFIYFQF